MITNTELAVIDDVDGGQHRGAESIEVEVEPTAAEVGLRTRVEPGVCRAYERGMVTAEWAIGVVVAVSLAGLLLLFIVKGPAKELLTGIILKIINLVSSWGLKG